MNNLLSFFHYDLDGIVSFLSLKWAFPKTQIDFKYIKSNEFYSAYLNFFQNSDKIYDTIYILDLDVSKYYNLFNNQKTFIIDHHKVHEDNMPRSHSKLCTRFVKSTTSTAKLCLNLFERIYNAKFTDQQKYLLNLADDYDSYACMLKESRELNYIWWGCANNDNDRINYFIDHFGNGFYGISPEDRQIVNNYIESSKNTVAAIQNVYQGNIRIGQTEYKVMSTFANKHHGEIAEYLINDKDAEIVFIVNPDKNHVSIRKSNTINVNLGNLAKKLCDGGGHDYSAGGKITEEFLEFSKMLTKI